MHSHALRDAAHLIEADEFVLPDEMGNCDMTIHRSRTFLAERVSWTMAPKFAAVVQGQSWAEWQKCINAYAFDPLFSDVTTLMFPRCMNTAEHKMQRFQFMQAMFLSGWWKDIQEERQFEVHCLGASAWVREVAALMELPEVRSIDTSLPVVLGLDGIDIRRNVYVGRQPGYFEMPALQPNDPLRGQIVDNIFTYFDWAGYDPTEEAS